MHGDALAHAMNIEHVSISYNVFATPRMHEGSGHDLMKVPHGIGPQRRGMGVAARVGKPLMTQVIHLIVVVETQAVQNFLIVMSRACPPL